MNRWVWGRVWILVCLAGLGMHCRVRDAPSRAEDMHEAKSQSVLENKATSSAKRISHERTPPDDPAQNATIYDAQSRLVSAYCRSIEQCPTLPRGLDVLLHSSPMSCQNMLKFLSTERGPFSFFSVTQAPNYEVNWARLDACVQMIDSGCGYVGFVDNLLWNSPFCRGIFEPVRDRIPCASSRDCGVRNLCAFEENSTEAVCVPGERRPLAEACNALDHCAYDPDQPIDCVYTDDFLQGRCEKIPPLQVVGLDAPCSALGRNTHTLCERGLFCGEDGLCHEPAQDGALCFSNTACAIGSICVMEEDQGRGRCQPMEFFTTENAPCNALPQYRDDLPEGPRFCDHLFYLICDRDSHQCKPFGKAGCYLDEHCESEEFCNTDPDLPQPWQCEKQREN